jgi:hypothetical protein
LVNLFYLLDIFIGRTFHRFQLFLHLQCLASLDVSLLFKSLDCLGQLTFLLLSLGQGFLYSFEFCQQGFPLCRRSEIFCFSTSHEDFRIPMLLCFSLARCFTFITSSKIWA